jgi:hypothetical protein
LLLLRADGQALVLHGAAVPLFVAGVLAVRRGGQRSKVSRPRRARTVFDEPECGTPWPVILRLAVVVTVMATAGAVLVWVYVVDALDMAAQGWRSFSGGLLIFCCGAGMVTACRRCRLENRHGMGSFGVRCALAGGVMALGMALFNIVTRASYPAFLQSPAAWVLWILCAGAPLVVISHVLGRGVVAFLERSAGDPKAGAALWQMMLAGAALAVLVVTFTLLERLGSYPTLVAMALVLLAMGGTLIIHDPFSNPAAHRLRLAGVFGGVIAMTFLMPEAGRRWLGHQQRLRGRLVESWWVTHELANNRPALSPDGSTLTGVDALIDWYQMPVGARVGVVSLFADKRLTLPDSFSGRVSQWAVLGGATAGRGSPPGTAKWSALRALRASRERYDVLIVELGEAPAEFAQSLLSEGLMERVWVKLAPDGLLLCAFPASAQVESAMRAGLAATALQGAGASAAFQPVSIAGRACLTVTIDRAGGQIPRLAEWTAGTPDAVAAGR